MVSRGAVVAYEVALEVIVGTEIETLEIFNVLEIHVDVVEIIFVQELCYFPIVPAASAH